MQRTLKRELKVLEIVIGEGMSVRTLHRVIRNRTFLGFCSVF